MLKNLIKGMKIYIFVNNKLKFISKLLPMLNLKSLNDNSNKQEGVPYNISIGGGTQGLAEVIYVNYYYESLYTLPIEKHFAGNFVGDIKSFSFFI